jgi:tRNA 2-thiouridine synthesizing protein A
MRERSLMMAQQLDVRGEICPYPMMHTVQTLKKLPKGEVLEVMTDHAPALETIPTQGARLGYAYTIEGTGASEWKIVLTPKNSG